MARKTRKPVDSRWGVYDIEARRWVNFVVAATWVDGDTGPRFHTSIFDLYEYMKAHPVRRWYAHNGGNYDALFLLPMLVEDGARFALQGSRILRAETADLDLRDSVKLLPSSLDDIGASLGVAKGRISYRGLRDNAETRKYLARDCEILVRALQDLRVVLNEDVLPATIASWGIGQIKDYGHESLLGGNRTGLQLNEDFRPWVFGGRTEVIRTRLRGRVTSCDIRSSYARSAMDGLPGKYRGCGVGAPGSYKLYRARVKVPKMHVPPLPYRSPSGKLYFPTGEWETWLCDPEMQALLEAGGKARIYETHAFSPCDAAARFAREIWAKREEEVGFRRFVWKCVLNWSFGKFSEHPVRELVHSDVNGASKGWAELSTWLGLWTSLSKVRPKLFHTPAGGWITSHARAREWRALVAGEGDPAYCDTDNVKAHYLPPVDFGKACGQWSLEYEGRYGARFVAPKVYYVPGAFVKGEEVAHAKGFSDLDRDVDRQTIVALVMGKKTRCDRIRKFRQAVREAKTTKALKIKRVHMEKGLNLGEDSVPKRHFYDDGTSRPLSIEECQAQEGIEEVFSEFAHGRAID